MDIRQAKEIVCSAGLKLVQEGLVARTWGNISCKADENTFVITPSGRDYTDLTPSDIVEVRIEDLFWTGPIKPSSEKGLHGEIYKQDSSIGAVIHTHQLNASVVASARREIPLISREMESIIGSMIPCASYALPGTGKLKRETAAVLKSSGSKAALMANHGAVCIGQNMEKAFEVALTLEEICALFIKMEYERITGNKYMDQNTMYEYYIKKQYQRGQK